YFSPGSLPTVGKERQCSYASLGAAETGWDGEIFDEDELEHSALSPHIFPPVNKAIQHALKYTELDKEHGLKLNLGRAGRTYYEPGGDRRFKPDWALCCPSRRSLSGYGDFRYRNLLPGDSKLSNKWQSSWHTNPDPVYILTLESVLTLEIIQRGPGYFYFYRDDD
ncbi:hypothetical protein FPOA_12320, partial [Fusarium poae]